MTRPISSVLTTFVPRRHGTEPTAAPPISSAWSHVPDEQLLNEIAKRDLDALAELYDRHARSCWSLAKQLTSDDESAAQAVCATFIEIWHRPPQWPARQVPQRLTALTYRNASRSLR